MSNKLVTSIACGLILSTAISSTAFAGATTADGWYESEEIYYILGGLEDVSGRGKNQLYLIRW